MRSAYVSGFCRAPVKPLPASQFSVYSLLRVPCQQRDVEQQGNPVSIDQEERGQESVEAGLGDDVHVEAVAEVDRVDVVAFEIGVHDGEEDLEEKIDGIEEDGEQEQPR